MFVVFVLFVVSLCAGMYLDKHDLIFVTSIHYV